jgi:predicted metal-binding membrane protein
MTPEARRRRQIRTPVLVVAALAWTAIVLLAAVAAGSPDDPNSMAGMAGMTSDLPAHRPSTFAGLNGFLAGWPLMLIGMMAPLLIPALRHAYDRSLPGRRGRTLTLLIASYLATWLVAGFVLQELSTGLLAVLGRGALFVGLLFVLIWQFSPVKQRCLNRHHAHPPLAAFGRAADLAAIRFGRVQASWCVGCCWSLMLLPLLAGRWQLATMLLVSLWIWGESFDTPARPAWRVRLPVRAARIVAAASRP